MQCAYDLAGLSPGSSCPECGRSDPHLRRVEPATSFNFHPQRAAYLLAVTLAESFGLFALDFALGLSLRATMRRQGYQPATIDLWLQSHSSLDRLLEWPSLSPPLFAAHALAAAAPFAALSRHRWWLGSAALLTAAALALIDTRYYA